MATDRHQAPSYPLRMPEELKSKIASAAESAGRSLHAELLVRLEASFSLEAEMSELRKKADDAERRQVLAELSAATAKLNEVTGSMALARLANAFPDGHAHEVEGLEELIKTARGKSTEMIEQAGIRAANAIHEAALGLQEKIRGRKPPAQK